MMLFCTALSVNTPVVATPWRQLSKTNTTFHAATSEDNIRHIILNCIIGVTMFFGAIYIMCLMCYSSRHQAHIEQLFDPRKLNTDVAKSMQLNEFHSKLTPLTSMSGLLAMMIVGTLVTSFAISSLLHKNDTIVYG